MESGMRLKSSRRGALEVQDAPEVQQKSSKDVQKAKIEPEREREHGFAGVPESTRSARRSS